MPPIVIDLPQAGLLVAFYIFCIADVLSAFFIFVSAFSCILYIYFSLLEFPSTVSLFLYLQS